MPEESIPQLPELPRRVQMLLNGPIFHVLQEIRPLLPNLDEKGLEHLVQNLAFLAASVLALGPAIQAHARRDEELGQWWRELVAFSLSAYYAAEEDHRTGP